VVYVFAVVWAVCLGGIERAKSLQKSNRWWNDVDKRSIKMTGDEMTKDETTLVQMTLDEMTSDKMPIDKMTFDEMTMDEMT
jgi:hypothetical protein